MRRPLSIRAKLLTGLALVLAISVVLTVNTLVGLYSYRNSIRAFDSQARELALAKKLWNRVAELDRAAAGTAQRPLAGDRVLLARLDAAELALQSYRDRLQATLRRGRDPDEGKVERPLVEAIATELGRLRALLGGSAPLDRRALSQRLDAVRSLVGDLLVPAYTDMAHLVGQAKSRYAANLWIGWFSGGLVLLMILILSRLTYHWIFHPIRQLHAGVQRVGQGELDYRVELGGGDEIKELADAFNRMTARLQQICRNLEQQVQERSRQLVRSERLASVGFLAAGVAHEINNPLAAISFSAESLQGRLEELLGAQSTDLQQIATYLRVIQSEAFRCKSITEKLLDFARMREPQRRPSPLAQLVAEVIDVVRHLGRYRDKNIVLQCSSEVTAAVNPQEFKQVVLNLVVNALDSMDDGGTLEVQVRRHGDRAEVVFTDDGCGMEPEVLENIFEPFFTRNRAGKGTGLGLSITHRIVTEHGGQIEAASDGPGKGSRFTVRLPVSASQIKEDADRERNAA